jgi:hypothetical protein
MLIRSHLHASFESLKSWGVDSSGVIHVLGTGEFEPPPDILRLEGRKIALSDQVGMFPFRFRFACPTALQLHLDLCRAMFEASAQHE